MTDVGLLSPGAHRGAAATDDTAVLQALLDAEAAWVAAQAGAGLAPAAAAGSARAAARAEDYDAADLARRAEGGGNPVIPLLADYRRRLGQLDPDAVRFVHRGLTSQDVMDTAMMLVVRRAAEPLARDLRAAQDALARLADEHRGTVQAARTLTQHALPTTFGLKAAGWLAGLQDLEEDLAELARPPLACGGAAGTLAGTVALFPHAPEAAQQALDLAGAWAEELGLDLAPHVWHTTRRPVLRAAHTFAAVCAALGRIANDVLLLSRPELGELREPAAAGRGVSSAMPQKQNPVLSVLLKRTALTAPQLVAQVHVAAAAVVDERPDGAWHAEWPALRELARLAVAASSHAAELTAGLSVDASRMRAHLEASGPGVLAERISAALAPLLPPAADGSTGAQQVQAAVREHAADRQALGEALVRLAAGTTLPDGTPVDASAVAGLLEPTGYLGAHDLLIDRVLERHRRTAGGPPPTARPTPGAPA
ncbi:lyase family protein [Kocuria turfanensis]|uniref:3-carboxy-cis,cis-muconate cycloisomerase n=1 Tax=Kocuria turfanensis TaxID=388357 RepID=A0A512IBC0_9MICC|nr:lyase family protein [Kocuria turfanensis]GEO94989.1 3-carboxy-cis,cis-muconate cycloisomerase [Kocuria turfanensis]